PTASCAGGCFAIVAAEAATPRTLRLAFPLPFCDTLARSAVSTSGQVLSHPVPRPPIEGESGAGLRLCLLCLRLTRATLKCSQQLTHFDAATLPECRRGHKRAQGHCL